jgi:hypothetical protein
MSGLARNPANREITSSSGTSEHQDIFFSIFFNFFLASFSQKTWKKYDLFSLYLYLIHEQKGRAIERGTLVQVHREVRELGTAGSAAAVVKLACCT